MTFFRLFHLLAKGDAVSSVSDLLSNSVDNLYDVFSETEREAWCRLKRQKGLSTERVAAVLELLADTPVPKRMVKPRDQLLALAMAEDWKSILKSTLVKKLAEENPMYYSQPFPDELVSLLSELVVHAKAQVVQELADQTEANFDLLKRFDVCYENRKRERRGLLFNDVTRALVHLSKVSPDAERSHDFRLDGDFQHLLLDEFQDTSLLQWQVLRGFARRATATANESEAGSFFCVGDTKQAIYGWRGGRAELFEAIPNELPDIHEETLSKSYRSAQAIVDFANHLFTRVDQHDSLDRSGPKVRQWVRDFPPHTTDRNELAGFVRVEVYPGTDESGDEKKAFFFDQSAQKIAQLVANSPGRSVAVLVPKNSQVAAIIARLRQMGIHASEEGGNPLVDSAAVQLILSLMRLADHPGDTVVRFHLAESPLAKRLAFAGGGPEALSKENERAAARASQAIRRQLEQVGYGKTIARWSHRSGASLQ